jgi:ubiquinone/menaquinone biosynthesis C-methylase UbiE
MNEGVFDVSHAHKLDNPGRIENLKPRKLLEEVALVAPGDVCVDFGSGTGVFAIPMAEMCGSTGRVFAVDRSPEMLGHIIDKKPPKTLVLVHSDVQETGLCDGISDVCLMAFILHEVEVPGKLIAEALRLLKPGGRLIVVEWKAELDSPGPPRKVRISQQQVMSLFDENGLTRARYIDWAQDYYAVAGSKSG